MTYYRRMWISGDTVNEDTLGRSSITIKISKKRNQ